MDERWKPLGFQLSFLVAFLLIVKSQVCDSLNVEGLTLLKFRERVKNDPYGVFANWNSTDANPCLWLGVRCVHDEVHMLDLHGFSLEGTLAPELEKLSQLRSLVLSENHFSGFIPKEFGGLSMLEVLDLRYNNLTGMLPVEMVSMMSLKELLLHGNMFHGSVPSELEKLISISDLHLDQNFSSAGATETSNRNRRFGQWLKIETDKLDINGEDCCIGITSSSSEVVVSGLKSMVSIVRRRLFEVAPVLNGKNLAAAPLSDANLFEDLTIVFVRSGAYPAVKNASFHSPLDSLSPSISTQSPQSQNSPSSQQKPVSATISTYLVPGMAFAVLLSLAVFALRRKKPAHTHPSISGLHGSLKKAIVEGITKLNRGEVESACEEFSNIVSTAPCCIAYKGTLTSGVEIATVSTTVAFADKWSKHAQKAFKAKIDSLSRVNHKNYINLLGYCEEEKPFTRMMVFEFAPNGTLYEHLHVEEAEHIDWNARVRIIMGIAYCLHYMHHDLNPPAAQTTLQSDSVFLTDDYAAKVGEFAFWVDLSAKANVSNDNELDTYSSVQSPTLEENVYNFGVLMLEIITGKLPYDEEQGYLVNWAYEYLADEQRNKFLVDPHLKSSKENEVDVMCQVILECIKEDPRERPTFREVISKLRQVIQITSDQATPKLSPLWWAELELLSNEGS